MTLEVNPGVESVALGLIGPAHNDLIVDYLKDRVGDGPTFENDAMRLVLSPRGFYCEFHERPTAFQGALHPVSVEHLSAHEARASVWEAISLYRSGQASIVIVYGPDYARNDGDVFLGARAGEGTIERGRPRVDAALYLRADIDAKEPAALLGARRGTAVLVASDDGEHVLLRVPRGGRPVAVMPGVSD